VRDALFNILAGRIELAGARVLDLFAGTGALGLEALRRGAASAVFVEHDHALADALRVRGRAAALTGRMEVWRKDAAAAVRELGRAGRQFDLIMLDPPYGLRWIPRILEAIVAGSILAPGGFVVAEGHWRDRPAASGLALIRDARYGDTVLWFFEQAREESAR
jgi:16S rRNA (guanine966-N2)-methyltransferase